MVKAIAAMSASSFAAAAGRSLLRLLLPRPCAAPAEPLDRGLGLLREVHAAEAPVPAGIGRGAHRLLVCAQRVLGPPGPFEHHGLLVVRGMVVGVDAQRDGVAGGGAIELLLLSVHVAEVVPGVVLARVDLQHRQQGDAGARQVAGRALGDAFGQQLLHATLLVLPAPGTQRFLPCATRRAAATTSFSTAPPNVWYTLIWSLPARNSSSVQLVPMPPRPSSVQRTTSRSFTSTLSRSLVQVVRFGSAGASP